MHKQNKRHRKVRKSISGPNFSGQHLLHNPKTIKEMIRAASFSSEDLVLDIGAGKGALTFRLAEKAREVIAIDHDQKVIEILRQRAEYFPNINVIKADFRFWKLPKQSFWVVANIPFSITTIILDKLLGVEGKYFQGGALIMEKGAAHRFTANRTVDPRLLMWRMNFQLVMKSIVPRTHFSPPPRVDGAIVVIVRRECPLLLPGQYNRFYALQSTLYEIQT